MSWSVRRDLLFIGNIRFIIQIRIYFSIVLATLVRPFTAMGVPRWWHRFSYLVEDLFSVHGMFYIILNNYLLVNSFIGGLKILWGGWVYGISTGLYPHLSHVPITKPLGRLDRRQLVCRNRAARAVPITKPLGRLDRQQSMLADISRRNSSQLLSHWAGWIDSPGKIRNNYSSLCYHSAKRSKAVGTYPFPEV
jgi:hypothetical protein